MNINHENIHIGLDPFEQPWILSDNQKRDDVSRYTDLDTELKSVIRANKLTKNKIEHFEKKLDDFADERADIVNELMNEHGKSRHTRAQTMMEQSYKNSKDSRLTGVGHNSLVSTSLSGAITKEPSLLPILKNNSTFDAS